MNKVRMFRYVVSLAVSSVLLSAATGEVLGQTYPNKPIRMVVPSPAGGVTDILARVIGQKLTATWGQQVVVDNRPGAAGNIGTEIVAKATADGYTLVMGNVSTHATNVSLYTQLPYDPVKDFAPVTLVASTPFTLVVHPSVPASSLKELIALAKSKPGHLNFASFGSGSSAHLTGDLFKSTAGVDLVHISYKGSAPAITDLIGGQVQLMFTPVPSALPHVKAGKLRALAVASVRRSVVAPDVPTFAEAGLPGFVATAWFGVLAPSKTPTEIIAKLNTEIVKILNMADVKERLLNQGTEPETSTPDEFAVFIKAEITKWADVVKKSGARLD